MAPYGGTEQERGRQKDKEIPVFSSRKLTWDLSTSQVNLKVVYRQMIVSMEIFSFSEMKIFLAIR